jgi:glutaminase
MVTARELAIMSATLANGGINPLSHQRIIPAQYVKLVLAEMVVNGLYENSGEWWVTVGLPTKGGVGGAVIAIVPHQMAIVAFSPPIDASGNSVRGQRVIEEFSRLWHLHLLDR